MGDRLLQAALGADLLFFELDNSHHPSRNEDKTQLLRLKSSKIERINHETDLVASGSLVRRSERPNVRGPRQ
jgi:hypothetical protein